MGWLIASEFVGGDRPIGTWNNGRISGHTDELLTRGSVCVDVMLRNGVVKPSRLIHFETDRGWARRFILFLNPDGSISVEHRQGAGHAYVRVSPGGRNSQRLRIVYSWDAPARIGLLSVEDLDAGTIRQAEQAAPLPVPMGDLRDIAAGRDTCCVDAAVLSIAIQDDVQRIGPGPSIAAGVPIRTAMGYRPVEQIRPGDLVITRSGEALPVRWVIGDTRPGVGYSAPVRLRAPYLGLGSDITLTSTHMVQITAGDIEHSLG